MMLPVVEQHAAHTPKRKLRACSGDFKRWDLARRLATDVHDHNIWPIPHRVPSLLHAPAQIYLFIIEEESWVEVSHIGEGLSANNRIRSWHPIYTGRFTLIGPGPVEPSKKPRSRKPRHSTHTKNQIIKNCWKHPSRGLERAVGAN